MSDTQTADLVARLRRSCERMECFDAKCATRQAADLIEAQQARIAELVHAYNQEQSISTGEHDAWLAACGRARAAEADAAALREKAAALEALLRRACNYGFTIVYPPDEAVHPSEIDAVLATAPADKDEPCHGPDDRWCPACGLGGKQL